MDGSKTHGKLTWSKQTGLWHLTLTDDEGGTVTAETTDRQVLLDLVAITQRNNHPVTVDSVSDALTELTSGKAQITKVMNLKQDPPPEPVVIRIGDAERTATCDLLATHFTEGRITQEEFDERSAKAIAAHVQPELDALLVDMPKVVLPPPPTPPSAMSKMLEDLKLHEVRERERRRAALKSAAVIAYALIGIVAMILIVMKVR